MIFLGKKELAIPADLWIAGTTGSGVAKDFSSLSYAQNWPKKSASLRFSFSHTKKKRKGGFEGSL